MLGEAIAVTVMISSHADVDALVDALRWGRRDDRRAAVRRLGAAATEEATEALCEAMADPDPEIARLARTALGALEDRLNRAILGVREELRTRPESALAYAALGDLYAAHGDLAHLDLSTRRYYVEVAVKAYARALKLSQEKIPELFLSMARALLKLGRHKVALGFFDRAAAALPEDARPLLGRAETLLAEGRFAEVRRHCARARALGVRDPLLRPVVEFWTAGDLPADAATVEPPPEVHKDPSPSGLVRVLADEARPAAGAPAANAAALESEVRSIVADLHSPEGPRRDEAFYRLLAYAGDDAVALTGRLVKGAPETVRSAWCRYLGRTGGALALSKLASLLDAPEDALRREAAAELDRIESGPEKTAALLGALDRGSPFARATAAGALAAARAREAVRPLIRNLRHARPEVREACIAALRRLADPRAVGPIARLIGDRRAETRFQAVLALGDLGDPRARSALERACRDSNPAVRQAAVFGLARSAGLAAAQELARALRSDEDPAVRQEAARRLGAAAAARRARGFFGVPDPAIAAGPLLEAAATDPSDCVRLAARVAVDGLPAAALFGPLLAALGHEDARIRHAAAVNLGRLGPEGAARAEPASEEVRERALEALAEALRREPDGGVRAGIASALGEIGRKAAPARSATAAARLEVAIGDADERVAAAAAVALGKLISDEALEALARRLAALEGEPPLLVRQALLKLAGEAARREWIPEALFDLAVAGLEDVSSTVRWLAAQALGRTGRKEALEPLLELIEREDLASNRAAATQAIATILDGDPFPLFERLEAASGEGERARPGADRAVLAALAAVTPRPGLVPAAVQKLLGLRAELERRGALLDAERDFLAFFRHAPGELGRLVGELAEPRIAAEAARAIGRLGSEGVPIAERRELREALAARDPAVRRAAAEALGELRDEESVAVLVAMAARDDREEVADAARRAVARILKPTRGPLAAPSPSVEA